MDKPWVAVLQTDSTREMAFDAFGYIRGYAKRFIDHNLEEWPGGVSFESRSKFDQWKKEFAPKVTGSFAYLACENQTEYYDVSKAVNGQPTPHIRHENYRQELNRDKSYSLRNTATNLASKLGARPARSYARYSPEKRLPPR